MRATLSGLGLGDVQLQEFGGPTDVLIRVAAAAGRRAGAAGGRRQGARRRWATTSTTAASRWSGRACRRSCWPTSTIGLVLAIFAILIYLWFRFEWQFALGAMIANVHDLVLTIGFMSLTQIDFDLTSIAALLTILGYSLNDTVVIYDRIREMLRRYKKMPMPELLNISINSTLSRSIITHVTVTLALLALLLFGGHAIHSFAATMMFGVVLVGTYTSIFIAAPILIYLGVGTTRMEAESRRRSRRHAKVVRCRLRGESDPVRRRRRTDVSSAARRLAPMQDAFAHCEALVRAADRDRFLATLFAPARTARRAVCALRLQRGDRARARSRARAAWRAKSGCNGGATCSPATAAARSRPIRWRRRLRATHGALPVAGGSGCRRLIAARRFDLYDEPMATLADLEAYADGCVRPASSRWRREFSTAAASRDIDALGHHAGVAHAIAGLLKAFPVHAARGQLFVPLEILRTAWSRPAGRRERASDAGNCARRWRDLRGSARRHLAAARS